MCLELKPASAQCDKTSVATYGFQILMQLPKLLAGMSPLAFVHITLFCFWLQGREGLKHLTQALWLRLHCRPRLLASDCSWAGNHTQIHRHGPVHGAPHWQHGCKRRV
jgi:hypothetical protein